MTSNKKHDELIVSAKRYLSSIGATNIEKEVEVTIGNTKMRVDLTALKGKASIAVECGNTPADKIVLLHSQFDRVIIFPHDTYTIVSDEVSEIMQLREINEDLTIKIHKLSGEVETYRDRVSSDSGRKMVLNNRISLYIGCIDSLLGRTFVDAYSKERFEAIEAFIDYVTKLPNSVYDIRTALTKILDEVSSNPHAGLSEAERKFAQDMR